MRKWLRQLLLERISTKLIAMVLILLILCATFISTSYFGSSVSNIGNSVRASTEQGAKQTADYLSLILTVATDMSQQIFRNSQLQDALEREQQGKMSVEEKFAVVSAVGRTLNNTIYTSSFVRSIYILKEQGDSWGSGLFNPSKVKRYTLSAHEWYSDVVNNKKNELWLPLNYDPFSGGGEDTELVLTRVDAFRDLHTSQTQGVILVNLDGKLIIQAIQRIKLGQTGSFFVVNPQGTVMISADPEAWGKPVGDAGLRNRLQQQKSDEEEFELPLDGTTHYVISRKMNNGWMLVGQVPVKEIIGGIQLLQRKITLYTGLFLLLAFVIGFLFSKRITKPIKELTGQMKELENSQFHARTQIRSRDEIGRLALSFNQMAEKIESLIEEVQEAGARKREAEVRALRYQINPHFLYNTLSTVRWMIRLQNHDGAYKGIAALVELMEASMGKNGVFTTLREELELLSKYMVIQQFRYGSGLKLEVEMGAGADKSELLDRPIPRMLLQPIVENAIFHGIAPKDGVGTIRIRLESSGSSLLRIIISDDGIGMAKELLGTLLQAEIASQKGLFGIGLRHVDETIRLYYATGSGVRIESENGGGTTVTLTMAGKGEMALEV